VTCAHFFAGYGICKAFPDGIPGKVLSGEVDHSKPIKGDGGIVRAEIPKEMLRKV
tara:strand:+ start:15848 stop:16012 length:165 start_codon:yes stop_codon:yes gene_type:complete